MRNSSPILTSLGGDSGQRLGCLADDCTRGKGLALCSHFLRVSTAASGTGKKSISRKAVVLFLLLRKFTV